MKQTIDYFDRARKKRHRVIYEEPGCVFRSKSATFSEQTGRPFGAK